jgi:hypothetical protein
LGLGSESGRAYRAGRFTSCNIGHYYLRESRSGEEEVSEVPALTDGELFIDSGYLSGLEAQSEITRLLDEIFGRLD